MTSEKLKTVVEQQVNLLLNAAKLQAKRGATARAQLSFNIIEQCLRNYEQAIGATRCEV